MRLVVRGGVFGACVDERAPLHLGTYSGSSRLIAVCMCGGVCALLCLRVFTSVCVAELCVQVQCNPEPV